MANIGDRPVVEPMMREIGDWDDVSRGLHSWTQRKAVVGGWLYRTVVDNTVAMCFVPDASVSPVIVLP